MVDNQEDIGGIMFFRNISYGGVSFHGGRGRGGGGGVSVCEDPSASNYGVVGACIQGGGTPSSSETSGQSSIDDIDISDPYYEICLDNDEQTCCGINGNAGTNCQTDFNFDLERYRFNIPIENIGGTLKKSDVEGEDILECTEGWAPSTQVQLDSTSPSTNDNITHEPTSLFEYTTDIAATKYSYTCDPDGSDNCTVIIPSGTCDVQYCTINSDLLLEHHLRRDMIDLPTTHSSLKYSSSPPGLSSPENIGDIKEGIHCESGYSHGRCNALDASNDVTCNAHNNNRPACESEPGNICTFISMYDKYDSDSEEGGVDITNSCIDRATSSQYTAGCVGSVTEYNTVCNAISDKDACLSELVQPELLPGGGGGGEGGEGGEDITIQEQMESIRELSQSLQERMALPQNIYKCRWNEQKELVFNLDTIDPSADNPDPFCSDKCYLSTNTLTRQETIQREERHNEPWIKTYQEMRGQSMINNTTFATTLESDPTQPITTTLAEHQTFQSDTQPLHHCEPPFQGDYRFLICPDGKCDATYWDDGPQGPHPTSIPSETDGTTHITSHNNYNYYTDQNDSSIYLRIEDNPGKICAGGGDTFEIFSGCESRTCRAMMDDPQFPLCGREDGYMTDDSLLDNHIELPLSHGDTDIIHYQDIVNESCCQKITCHNNNGTIQHPDGFMCESPGEPFTDSKYYVKYKIFYEGEILSESNLQSAVQNLFKGFKDYLDLSNISVEDISRGAQRTPFFFTVTIKDKKYYKEYKSALSDTNNPPSTRVNSSPVPSDTDPPDAGRFIPDNYSFIKLSTDNPILQGSISFTGIEEVTYDPIECPDGICNHMTCCEIKTCTEYLGESNISCGMNSRATDADTKLVKPLPCLTGTKIIEIDNIHCTNDIRDIETAFINMTHNLLSFSMSTANGDPYDYEPITINRDEIFIKSEILSQDHYRIQLFLVKYIDQVTEDYLILRIINDGHSWVHNAGGLADSITSITDANRQVSGPAVVVDDVTTNFYIRNAVENTDWGTECSKYIHMQNAGAGLTSGENSTECCPSQTCSETFGNNPTCPGTSVFYPEFIAGSTTLDDSGCCGETITICHKPPGITGSYGNDIIKYQMAEGNLPETIEITGGDGGTTTLGSGWNPNFVTIPGGDPITLSDLQCLAPAGGQQVVDNTAQISVNCHLIQDGDPRLENNAFGTCQLNSQSLTGITREICADVGGSWTPATSEDGSGSQYYYSFSGCGGENSKICHVPESDQYDTTRYNLDTQVSGESRMTTWGDQEMAEHSDSYTSFCSWDSAPSTGDQFLQNTIERPIPTISQCEEEFGDLLLSGCDYTASLEAGNNWTLYYFQDLSSVDVRNDETRCQDECDLYGGICMGQDSPVGEFNIQSCRVECDSLIQNKSDQLNINGTNVDNNVFCKDRHDAQFLAYQTCDGHRRPHTRDECDQLMNCQWDATQGICTNTLDNGQIIQFQPCENGYFVRKNPHIEVDSICHSLTDESLCNETGICEYDTNTSICKENISHELIYDKCVPCIDKGSETSFQDNISNIYKSSSEGGNCGDSNQQTIDQSDSVYEYCYHPNDNSNLYIGPELNVASTPCNTGDVNNLCTLSDYYKKKVTCSNKSNWEFKFGETPPASTPGVTDTTTMNTNILYFKNSESKCIGDIEDGTNDPTLNSNCNDWGEQIKELSLSETNNKILCETHKSYKCIYKGPNEWKIADDDRGSGEATKFTKQKTERELELDRHYREIALDNYNNYKYPVCSSRFADVDDEGSCIEDPETHHPLTRSASSDIPELCKLNDYFLVGDSSAKCVQCGHDELHNYKWIDGECRRMFCFCNAYNTADRNDLNVAADKWSNIRQPEDSHNIYRPRCQEGFNLIKDTVDVTMIEVCNEGPSISDRPDSSRCTSRDPEFYLTFDNTQPECKDFSGRDIDCPLDPGEHVKGCIARTGAIIPGITFCHSDDHCGDFASCEIDPAATETARCSTLSPGSTCTENWQCSNSCEHTCSPQCTICGDWVDCPRDRYICN